MKYDTKGRLLEYPVSLSMRNKRVSVLLYICLHIVLNISMCLNQIFTHSFKIFNVYSSIKKRKYAANLHCVDIVKINSLPASPPMFMRRKDA